MEDIKKLLENIKIKNLGSVTNFNLNMHVEKKRVHNLIKKVYIERMTTQTPLSKIEDIAILNKELNKIKAQNNAFFQVAIGFIGVISGLLMMMYAASSDLLERDLGEILKGNFIIEHIGIPFCFISIFLMIPLLLYRMKNVKKENKNKLKNRLVEIKNEIKESEYKEIIQRTSNSILEDLEKIEGFSEEKNILKKNIIVDQEIFEKDLKEKYYLELTSLNKDIKDKIIIKTDLNNDLLKVKT